MHILKLSNKVKTIGEVRYRDGHSAIALVQIISTVIKSERF